MEQKNAEYLKSTLKFHGFGEVLNSKLEKAMSRGEDKFSLVHQREFGKDKMIYQVNFGKGKEDMYFLNNYDATLHDENGSKESMRFYNDRGAKNITAKESYNLLKGRAVFRPKIQSKEGKEYSAWVKFDFSVRDEGGKPLAETYTKNYGYDIKNVVDQFPIEESLKAEDKEKLVRSLEKGNRQKIHFDFGGSIEEAYVEANPKYKTLNLYDSDGKKLYVGRSEKKGEGVRQDHHEKKSKGVKNSKSSSKAKKQKRVKMKV